VNRQTGSFIFVAVMLVAACSPEEPGEEISTVTDEGHPKGYSHPVTVQAEVTRPMVTPCSSSDFHQRVSFYTCHRCKLRHTGPYLLTRISIQPHAFEDILKLRTAENSFVEHLAE